MILRLRKGNKEEENGNSDAKSATKSVTIVEDASASEGLATDVEDLMGEEEAAARRAQIKNKTRKALSDKPQDMQVLNRNQSAYLG